MKKKLLSLLILPVMLFSACSGESSEPQKEVTPVSAKAVADEVLSAVEIVSCVEKGTSDLKDYYTSVDPSMVTEACFYLSGSGVYPDEICVIKVKNEADLEAVKEAARKHLDRQISTFESYSPDEMYKLDTAELYTVKRGADGENFVVLLATADNSAAKKAADAKLS